MSTPRTPPGLAPAGRRLWRDVTDRFDLAQHELRVLLEACRTADDLDKLHEITQHEGLVVDGPQGKKAHPAAVEARQMRLTLGRLLAILRVPDDPDTDQRGQRRAGFRGAYAGGLPRDRAGWGE